jgi:hypothetical protein
MADFSGNQGLYMQFGQNPYQQQPGSGMFLVSPNYSYNSALPQFGMQKIGAPSQGVAQMANALINGLNWSKFNPSNMGSGVAGAPMQLSGAQMNTNAMGWPTWNSANDINQAGTPANAAPTDPILTFGTPYSTGAQPLPLTSGVATQAGTVPQTFANNDPSSSGIY